MREFFGTILRSYKGIFNNSFCHAQLGENFFSLQELVGISRIYALLLTFPVSSSSRFPCNAMPDTDWITFTERTLL